MAEKSDAEAWQEFVDAGWDLYDRKRYALAEEKFKAALEFAEKFGEDDPRLARTVNNIAALYQIQGKYSLSEEMYTRALHLNERIHGADHPDVALNLHNLAVLYSATRRYAEAEELYRRALAMREKRLGPDHPDLLPVLRSYSQLLRRLDRMGEAKELDERAEAIASARG